MALIKCLECGQKISDAAKSCPHCGYRQKNYKSRNNSKMYKNNFYAYMYRNCNGRYWSWMEYFNSDKRLQLRAAYQFGTSVTESEWLAYQKISNIQSFVCNSGVVLFVIGIIGKIIIKIKR